MIKNKKSRTNIEIDDSKISKAMKFYGLRTKKQAVDLGLDLLVRLGHQKEFLKYQGKLKWSGDLETSRVD